MFRCDRAAVTISGQSEAAAVSIAMARLDAASSERSFRRIGRMIVNVC